MADRVIDVTVPGRFPNENTGPGRSTGETSGSGSLYSVNLVERQNGNLRNIGPERVPSRLGAALPIVTMASRKTGKLNA